MKPRSRKLGKRPVLEGLEDRRLLSGGVSTPPLKELAYSTPQGSRVTITLYGPGTLAGSTESADGALNLVYEGTTSASGIIARVGGRSRTAYLATIKDAAIPLGDLSGVGATPVGIVNLRNFNLIPGGAINMTGGVGSLFLNSMASNSQVHLSSIITTTTSAGTTESSGSLASTQSVATTPSASSTSPPAFSLTSPSSSSSTSASATTPVTSVSTFATSISSTSTTTITKITVPGVKPSFGQDATGANVVINHINAQAQQFPAVGDPQIYGYDPTSNSLIRFDALTGNATLTIPLSGFMATSTAGVSLGRDAGSLVVLAGSGTTIDAFNASTGAFVGGFSTADLASKGITSVDGLASTDVNTYVIDSTSNTTGTVVQIDLTKSLATGSAVAIGAPYSPKNHFFLSGAATGVPAKPVLYLGGTAAFISATPDQVQNGVLAATYQNGNLTEQTRGQLTQPASVAAPNPTSIPRALGSVEENLALDTGVQNGVNVVQLYSATSLAHIGTITLKDPNLLTDLSGSFHPELAGTALVDVQGNLRSFRSLKANGLVVNDNGFLNLVQINSLANSEVIGQPVGHTRIHMRNNVLILSADRVVGIRGGVFTVPNLLPVGPLTLPRD